MRQLPDGRGPARLHGLPPPGWDVAILDKDEQPVPQGEPGEICLRARSNPHYLLGYWNRPEDSEEVFGGDWFHTRTPPARTRTATSGTRAGPTT